MRRRRSSANIICNHTSTIQVTHTLDNTRNTTILKRLFWYFRHMNEVLKSNIKRCSATRGMYWSNGCIFEEADREVTWLKFNHKYHLSNFIPQIGPTSTGCGALSQKWKCIQIIEKEKCIQSAMPCPCHHVLMLPKMSPLYSVAHLTAASPSSPGAHW